MTPPKTQALDGAAEVHTELVKAVRGKPAYRPDIDGLRAVAILCVVLFHFGLGLPGGYVGVDVFFVISGYLITQGLLQQRRLDARGLLGFWARRVRRLLPALLVVCATTSFVAFFLLMPVELAGFGRSLVASLFFYSNYFFHSQAGYFDAPSLTKPLLHTWSLGVEAQFYLVFPLIIMLLRSKWMSSHSRWSAAALLGLFALSLAGSVYSIHRNPSVAFYSLPPRAWELLAGSLLAIGILPKMGYIRVNQVLQAAGIGLIAWSAWFYSPNTPFPGEAALPPVVGAFLLIYSRKPGWAAPISYALELPPLVWIGKISYSIYLWHWPLLVLLPHAFGRNPGTTKTVCALLLVLALAAFTYRFVECPFNQWRHRNRTKVVLSLGAALLFAMVIGFAVVVERSHGLPSRLSEKALILNAGGKDIAPAADRCHTISPERVLGDDICTLGNAVNRPPTFVVWGDSHAHAMYGSFNKLAVEHKLTGRHASYAACPPLIGVRIATHTTDACQRFNEAMVDYINAHDFKYVFLVARWSVYVHGNTPGGVEVGPAPLLVEPKGGSSGGSLAPSSEQLFARGIERTLNRLTAPGRTIYLVEQVPEALYDIPSSLARATLPFGLSQSALQPRRATTENRQRFVNQTFAAMKERYAIKIVRTHDFLCDADVCQIVHDGRSLYRDADHLSAYGADFVGPLLAPIFDEIERAGR